MTDAFICDAIRTPIGRYGGALAGVRADDLAEQSTFRLFPDGTGDGVGPSGERHSRFRAWKQDLLGRSDET